MKTDYPKLRAFLRTMSQIEQERFAARCNTTLNYLRKAMSKGSKMDVDLVERIVRNSGYVVPPEELRGDVKWDTFADASVVAVLADPAVARARASAVRRAEETAAPS